MCWLRSRKINIRFKGREYPFSDNILAAVAAIKDVAGEGSGGLIQTNEKIYDLLTLGKTFPQSIDADTKSFQLDYIDWQRPENNVYHVTEEFEVERSGSHEKRRPDVVLFVNGIPLVVIECKRPDLERPDRPGGQSAGPQPAEGPDSAIVPCARFWAGVVEE
ncbi:MAG: type I restriction endonuclease [Phycisphaerales bacterium]